MFATQLERFPFEIYEFEKERIFLLHWKSLFPSQVELVVQNATVRIKTGLQWVPVGYEIIKICTQKGTRAHSLNTFVGFSVIFKHFEICVLFTTFYLWNTPKGGLYRAELINFYTQWWAFPAAEWISHTFSCSQLKQDLLEETDQTS